VKRISKILSPYHKEWQIMDKYNIDDLIRFSDFFKKILTSLYGEESKQIYAYYEKRMNTAFSYPKIAITHPIAFKLYCGITKLESIIFTEENVKLFDVLYTGDCYEIKKLQKYVYAEEKEFFYETKGQRDNGWMSPKSELYISRNALDCLYANKSDTLINHNLLSSEFLKQIEEIYQAMIRKHYKITPHTTAKILYRDIIEPLYPEMSDNYKVIFCKIFKGES
jgi:hypothetical protein